MLHGRKEVKMDMELEEDMFIVDEIIDQRFRNGKLQYFVKWQGYPDPEDNTWEPAENLSSCPTVVEAFETKLKEKEEKKRRQIKLSTVSSAPVSKSVVTSTPIRPANAKLAMADELEEKKSELDGKTSELDVKKKSTKPPELKDRIRKDSSSKKGGMEMNNNESKSKSGVGEVPLNTNPKKSTNEKKSDSKKSSNEHKKTSSSSKSTSSKESTNAKETDSKSDRWPDGFDKKLEAEKIIAVTKHQGKMVFLVKFKNTNVCYLISKHRVYKHAPLIALKFFENKISWVNE